MTKRAGMTTRSITDLANHADAMDVYTVQSDQRGTMYLWDGKWVGLHFHSAVLRFTLEEAEYIAKEFLDVIEELKELKRMDIQFKGISALGRERTSAKQRKDNGVSLLCK